MPLAIFPEAEQPRVAVVSPRVAQRRDQPCVAIRDFGRDVVCQKYRKSVLPCEQCEPLRQAAQSSSSRRHILKVVPKVSRDAVTNYCNCGRTELAFHIKRCYCCEVRTGGLLT